MGANGAGGHRAAAAAALTSGMPVWELGPAQIGLSITATDLDPVMVGAATQRLKDHPHVTVQSADATRLPFDDDSSATT